MIELQLTIVPWRAKNWRDNLGSDLDKAQIIMPDGQKLKPQRVAMYGVARQLAALGYTDDTILKFRRKNCEHIDASGTIGELRKWIISESDKNGLQKSLWRPWNGCTTKSDEI